jgi:hypothetical protein
LATSYEPITTGAAKKVPPARVISAGFAEWAAVPLLSEFFPLCKTWVQVRGAPAVRVE